MENTKTEKIWIGQYEGIYELHIDWSNDRHQTILLTGNDPKALCYGLLEAHFMVKSEIRRGELS